MFAVTGHTSGIGKGLFEALSKRGKTIGFSRSNGYNLSDKKFQILCISEILKSDCSLVILNAYVGFSQTEMLIELASHWADKSDKTVVTISSIAPDRIPSIVPKYAIEKLSLDRAVREYGINKKWRLINIKPGFVDTPMVGFVKNMKKLPVSDIVNTIMWAIDAPDNMIISEITVCPRNV